MDINRYWPALDCVVGRTYPVLQATPLLSRRRKQPPV